MQFTISAAALVAFASGALAQLAGFDTMYKPASGQVIPAGQTYTIEWEAGPAEYDDQTISIVLLAGETPNTLEPSSEPIVSGLVNKAGSYDWAVPANLGDKPTYGLRIELESDPTGVFQYSFPFQIKGDGSEEEGTTSAPAKPTATDDEDCTTTAVPEEDCTTSAVPEEDDDEDCETTAVPAPPKTTAASNGTAVVPPKTTLATATGGAPQPTEEAEEPGTENPPIAAAPANGAMGTVALVAAVAVAAFTF